MGTTNADSDGGADSGGVHDAGPTSNGLEQSLRERLKELNCMYELSHLVDTHGDRLDRILQQLVHVVAASWQHQDITCARITFRGLVYETPGFRRTEWRQASTIRTHRRDSGTVEVCYLEEREPLDEGPFLSEERRLIDAVAERVGRITERIDATRRLESEKRTLNETNITLRQVLSRVQEQRREVAERVQANVDKIILPIINILEAHVDPHSQGYIRVVRKNLEDIASPFVSELSRRFMGLTATELQICEMIRQGLSTKEIAAARHLAPATIKRHRENIRSKLKINNRRVNLQTYLATNMNASSDGEYR